MERFTKKSNSILKEIEYQLIDEKESLCVNDGIKKIPVLATNKLGQLEDIEEELGIDLITLFKALKNGVYHFASDGVLIHDYGWLEDNYFYPEPHDKLSCSFRSNYEDELFYFKDYGKTWSIDKKDFMKKEN